jgi:hypothetical protein
MEVGMVHMMARDSEICPMQDMMSTTTTEITIVSIPIIMTANEDSMTEIEREKETAAENPEEVETVVEVTEAIQETETGEEIESTMMHSMYKTILTIMIMVLIMAASIPILVL